MPTSITASMLYDAVSCPHRVRLDLAGDKSRRDPPNEFVELLWRRGSEFEREVMSTVSGDILDLSGFSGVEKEKRTTAAIADGAPLIYSGRIAASDLVGEPDLLRREGGGYVAGDIKSGSAEEGPEDSSKPKIHYAVQLALYTDILEQLKVSPGRRGFIWDGDGREVVYDFAVLQGKRNPRTLWADYTDALEDVRAIVAGRVTLPAASAVCKLCHWHSACVEEIRGRDDLTMIAELGRSKRDVMIAEVQTVSQLAEIDLGSLIRGDKTVFPGIGPDTLRKYQARALLLTTKGAEPYTRSAIVFPQADRELFFDVEVDPMRDVCYLHGFVERTQGDTKSERFVAAFADGPTPEAERKAFAEAWDYIQSRQPCVVYYYSKYERTTYRGLQAKYPDVCSAEDVEALFDPARSVDLYTDVVKRWTEWPTWDFSIKTLAKFLGFAWRDTHPSGSASIEWFHRWCESQDPAIRQRILDYNEDDCRATLVLRDALVSLPVVPESNA